MARPDNSRLAVNNPLKHIRSILSACHLQEWNSRGDAAAEYRRELIFFIHQEAAIP
jgi:hypothetical protein